MYRTYSYNDMPIPVQRRNEDMRKPMPPPKKEIECKLRKNVTNPTTAEF